MSRIGGGSQVVSASRRTDVPAWYVGWLTMQIRRGGSLDLPPSATYNLARDQ